MSLPETGTPVAYAVVRDGALPRPAGPAYAAGAGRRFAFRHTHF